MRLTFMKGKNIPKNGSLLLRFTPLDGDYPKLIGSNLHLSIGATEIKEIYTTDKSMKIIFSNAGAQAGDLFFIAQKALQQAQVKIVRSLMWEV